MGEKEEAWLQAVTLAANELRSARTVHKPWTQPQIVTGAFVAACPKGINLTDSILKMKRSLLFPKKFHEK